MFNNIYKDRKVLITGHTGFKGSWLTLWLKELGADIIGYSLAPPTQPSMFEVLQLKDKINHIEDDIRNSQTLDSVFSKYNPEIIFHMAAQSLVLPAYEDPKTTYETNVMGTLNIFEAAKKTESVRAIINVTSDKCYENKEVVYGYREDDPMGGYDPYSSSKGCAELLTSSYRNSFFKALNKDDHRQIVLSSVRAGNVIGGGDWAINRLVPDCIKALSKQEKIGIRNPSATRPWQYILEPLSGYLWLASLMFQEGARYAEAWNFGPADSDLLPVEKLVNHLISLWGKGEYSISKIPQPYEAKLLKLDTSKARFYLKWKPLYGALKSIEKTTQWYKAYYLEDNTDMYKYTLNQIHEYSEISKELDLPWSLV